MDQQWPDQQCSNQVRELVKGRLGDIHHLIEPTPLSGALQIGALEVQAQHFGAKVSEEEFTSMLLGAFAATIPWFAEAFKDTATPSFEWGRHSKMARSEDGEASTGADFALLIKLPNGQARAAVFQAKPSEDGHSIKPHQISPMRDTEGKLPQPQLLRLADHGLKIMGLKSIDSDLNWVHYCCYARKASFCIPLSNYDTVVAMMRNHDQKIAAELKSEIDALRLKKDPSLSKNSKAAAERLWTNFTGQQIWWTDSSLDLSHLLALGAAVPPGDNAPGWLTLSGNSIQGFIATMTDIMSVFVATAISGPAHELSLASRAAMIAVTDELNSSSVRYVEAIRSELDAAHSVEGATSTHTPF